MITSLIDLLEVTDTSPDGPKAQIYCDMDGVLTDFDERFEHFSGMSPKEYESKYGTGPFWHLIDEEIGDVFWSQMKWMPGGKALWDYIKNYDPIILTSPSRHNASKEGKKMWVETNLSPTPKIVFSRSELKWKKAKPGDILIDDKPSNLQEWHSAKGIALRCIHGNINPVIEKLQKLGY